MTPQLIARPPEPRIHIRVDQWMTKSEFAALWRATNHDFNDAAYELEPVVPGVELVGIDSEGGGHD